MEKYIPSGDSGILFKQLGERSVASASFKFPFYDPTKNKDFIVSLGTLTTYLATQLGVSSKAVFELTGVSNTDNEYVSTLDITEYKTEGLYIFKPNVDSDDVATLDVNGIDALTIKKFDGTDLVDVDDLKAVNTYVLLNKTTYWLVVGGVSGEHSNPTSYLAHATVDGVYGDDSYAQLNNPKRPYRTINVAMDALKYAIITSISSPVQCRAFCHVKQGVYFDEYTINREYVDMHFDYGAIVISDTDGKPVICDTNGNNEPVNINITGEGQFYHTRYNPQGADNQAIALSNASSREFNFEAYEIDGIQIYGSNSITTKLNVKNTRIRYTIFVGNKKSIHFEKCKFLSGLDLDSFFHDDNEITCNECEFIVPSDNLDSLVEIRDFDNNLIDTIDVSSGVQSGEAFQFGSGTRLELQNSHVGGHYHPIIAGVYISNTYLNVHGNPPINCRYSITNSKIRIQKEGGVGIFLNQTNEVNLSSSISPNWIFRDIHIEDETSGKTTTGLLAKKIDTLSTTIPYMFASIISNCEITIGSGYEAGYVPIEPSYGFVPEGSSGGVSTFSALTDSPYDNVLLAEALDSKQDKPNGVLTGCTITLGSFPLGKNVRITEGTWRISPGEYGNVGSGDTDFLVALSASGSQRYVEIVGTSSNTIIKVEGAENAIAVRPTLGAGQTSLGSILVKDALIDPLADGKIWIGDGTDTAFPRTLSGDVTVSNLGVTSYNGIVPSTKGGAGAVNGILKANGSGVVSAATAGTDYISPLSLQTFDVNDYGATGNGSTDDLTAINSAITAVVANGGGVLLFRKGTYRVTAPITITGSNIIVTTLNKGTSIFLNFTTNAPNFNLIGNNNIISDLKFTGDQVFRSNGHTVYLRGNDNTVTRCTVVGSSCFSVYVGASGTSINTKIHQNHIYNSAADGIHASVGVTRCDIYDNYIHDVADDGIGIGYEGSASEVNIFSNNIVNTGARGITIMGGSRMINVSSNNITNTWLGGLYVECYTGSVSLVNITANNVYLAGAYTPPLALNARGSGVGGGIVVMAGTNGGSYGITSLSISNNNISSSWNSHIGIGYVNNGSSVFGISSLKVTGNICYGITNVGARGAALGTGGGVNAAPSPLSYAGIYVANSFNLDVSNNSINACNQEVVRIGSTCTGYNTVKNNFCVTPNQSGGANYAYYVEAGMSDILDNSVSLNGSTITGILLNSSQSVSSSNNSSSTIVNYSKYDGSSSGNPSYTALGTGSNIGINQISKGDASNQSLGNSNTVIGYVAQNTQAGTSAGSSLVVKNNNNTLQADLRINSTTFTTADLLAANQAYLLTTSNYLGIGSSAASGIFEIITGGTTYSNRRFKIDNGGNICTNSTASVLYRTTNAGSDIAAHFMNDPANSLSSGIAYGWSGADGQFYTQGNGTRRIKGAAVVPTSTSATPGSEGMDLVFQTQTGGAAAAQRLRIGATAITISDAVNLVLNTTTGTKIGTATTQKLAFYNSTPIVQPANTIAINDVLVNLGLRASGGSSNFTSDLKLDNVGTGFYVKEGTNATMGTATLASGTVTVSTTKVTANSRIYLTINGGTLTNVGTPYISARSAGTNFTISSTNVLDASNVAWVIVEPN